MTPLQTLKTAYKRAIRWGSFDFSGPFSVVRPVRGAGIAASNYGLALDESDYTDQTIIFADWGSSINGYCDSHKLDGDDSVSVAFACFLSRLFFVPTGLSPRSAD